MIETTIPAMNKPAPVTEMIGRIARGTRLLVPTNQTVDWTRVDWEFWDRLRRGKEPDYDLGGLFASPIAKILSSWTAGDGFSLDVDDADTSEYVEHWLQRRLSDILDTLYDTFSLGDAYLFVNPDGNLTRISPNQVQILCNPPSSQNVIGYKVTTRLEGATQIDYFYADRRVTEVHRGTIAGIGTVDNGENPYGWANLNAPAVYGLPDLVTGTVPANALPSFSGASVLNQDSDSVKVYVFPNLIGKIPLVHFANERGANELYGHPRIEALLKNFQRYNNTIHKALDGVELMGNPIPTIEGVDDPDGTLERIATNSESYVDQSGDTQIRYTVDMAEVPFMVVGEGGTFKLVSPQQFTGDASRMLELLFLLMLQHSGIPEWVWGGAVASSKASVDSQMPAFEKLINGIRQSVSGSLFEVMDLVVSWRTLYDPAIKPLDDDCTIGFAPITQENRDALVKELDLARREGAITRETLLDKLHMVTDPEEEVELARQEHDNEMPDDAAMVAYANMLNQNGDPSADPQGVGVPKPEDDTRPNDVQKVQRAIQ